MKFKKKIEKNEKKEKKIRRYASSLTYCLLLCLFVVSYSVFLNICKFISLQGKNIELRSILNETTEIHTSLEQQLNDLDARSYEAIARNNLKMSGENEVLIIVKDEEQELKNKKDKEKKKTKKKKKPNKKQEKDKKE